MADVLFQPDRHARSGRLMSSRPQGAPSRWSAYGWSGEGLVGPGCFRQIGRSRRCGDDLGCVRLNTFRTQLNPVRVRERYQDV